MRTEHLTDLLAWCRTAGVDQVTVFVCSTENLTARDNDEIGRLLQTVERLATSKLSDASQGWRVHLAGSLDVLPDSTRAALKKAVEATADCTDGQVTIAIGYGGRQEIVDAVRDLLDAEQRAGGSLQSLADRLTTDDIARHLYTAGLPDPDLIIRTSGEVRLSNFLLWQSTHSELYFCDVFWPGFREIDFLRALRAFARRNRP